MKKVLVIAKEYPEYYMKEMYVQEIRQINKINWYFLTFENIKRIGQPDTYMKESQIKHL